jgi:hypothetical protein
MRQHEGDEGNDDERRTSQPATALRSTHSVRQAGLRTHEGT